MKTHNAPTMLEGFQVEDPREVFVAYSQEEMGRREETNADFDRALYQEAVDLVLSRLQVDTVPGLDTINSRGAS